MVMKYFRLTDEIDIPGRWHLGQIFDGDRSRDDFLKGMEIDDINALSVEITHTGRALEFCLTSFSVPVAEKQIGEAIFRQAGSDLQRLPVRLGFGLSYDILNATRTVACLDEKKSEYVKWLPGDSRPDLVGQYRMVPRLIVDPRQVPKDAHFFRITGWRVALIVSESVMEAMEANGCFGAKFESVTII
jgi:hypothetical protein